MLKTKKCIIKIYRKTVEVKLTESQALNLAAALRRAVAANEKSVEMCIHRPTKTITVFSS